MKSEANGNVKCEMKGTETREEMGRIKGVSWV